MMQSLTRTRFNSDSRFPVLWSGGFEGEDVALLPRLLAGRDAESPPETAHTFLAGCGAGPVLLGGVHTGEVPEAVL